MSVDRYNLPPRTIMGPLSGTAVKIFATDWKRVDEPRNKARAAFELVGIFGTGASITVGLETCTDPRNPDSSATVLVTASTSDGIRDPDGALISIDLQAKLFYRIVWLLSGTSGTGGGSVQGWAELSLV